MPASELLRVEVLDDDWDVVPLSTGDGEQRVSGSTIRLVMRSDAAGPVGFNWGLDPCNHDERAPFLDYTVEALASDDAGADLESSSSARGEAEFE